MFAVAPPLGLSAHKAKWDLRAKFSVFSPAGSLSIRSHKLYLNPLHYENNPVICSKRAISVASAEYDHTPSTFSVLPDISPSPQVACFCWTESKNRRGHGSVTLAKQIFMINKCFIPSI